MAATASCRISDLVAPEGRRSRGGCFGGAETRQIVCGALRVCRGGEDRSLVPLQHGQPVTDIGGVVIAILKVQPQVGAKERGAQLSNKLLAGIAVVSEPLAAEITGKARGVPGPMCRLVLGPISRASFLSSS